MWYYTLLPKILNMSLTAGVVIVLVLLVRLPLKKAPKVFSYALWAVVLFRLLCPISFSSDFSLLGTLHSPAVTNGSITYIPSDIVHTEHPQVNLPLPGISQAINENLPQGEEQLVADPLEAPMALATLLWLFGIAAMLGYSIISVLILRNRLKGALNIGENIYEADNLKTPFVLGIFRPRIFIPAGLAAEEKGYIIRHEQTHIQRFDHIVKPFAFLVLSIHWFNPLVWVAFIVMGTDMELSCDERVIKEMGSDIKKAYSTSLLSLATEKRIINGSPLAFGEGNVGGRIKNVLNYKKPAFWIIASAVIACIIVSVCLLSNPKSNNDASNKRQYTEQLFGYRTSFVGDNSAVANIVSRLDFPANVKYDHIELQTASEPYGVELYFSVTPEVKAAYNVPEPEHIDSFRANACIMLSLIENADEIVFRFDDGTGSTVGRYFSREWAESIVGADLWAESRTADNLGSLIVRINEHVKSAYASVEGVSEGLPKGGFKPTKVVYLGSWYSVTADYFLEQNRDRIFEVNTGLFRDGTKEYSVQYAALDVGDSLQILLENGIFTLDLSGYSKVDGWSVLSTGGSDTGYRIFLLDNEMWIGHWGWYGSKKDAWWCEYIFRVNTNQPSSTAVTNSTDSNHVFVETTSVKGTGPFVGYEDGTTNNFDVYTEKNGTYIVSLPWSLFDDFPASDRTDPNWVHGWMNVDIYCGTINNFTWAVVCTGPSLGTGNANVCTSADGGKTWWVGDKRSMYTGTVTGAGFASSKVGYMSYRYFLDKGPEISRTLDGGKTWERMKITMPTEYQVDSYRFTPLVPLFDGSEGVYPILVYKWRSDGNYDQETIYMYTHDGGLSWAFK